MTSLKLYEAVEALGIIDEFLEESGGELTPEIEALLAKAEGDFDTKVERVALKVKELEGAATIAKAEKDRLASRQRKYENAATALKTYLARQLEAAKKEKVEGEIVTVAFQKNPESVEAPADLDLVNGVPAIFVRTVPATHELAKDVVKAHLQAVAAGTEARNPKLPEGVKLVRTKSLRIR
jgi:hypothetical protein